MKRLVKYISRPYSIIIFLAILLPLVLSLVLLLTTNLTFWYDNTRDLLSAWANLNKLTLIGPPSGIPGLFYGPYWIWLLSFGLFFSKNPLIVTIITATIPYFVIFPLVWFRFSKIFDKTSLILGWLLFMFASGMTYATQLWNLYPAPLITVLCIYLLVKANFKIISKAQIFSAIAIGFLMGLLTNFHISFGLAFLLGVIIFLIVETVISLIQSSKNVKSLLIIKLYIVIFMGTGFLVAFLPSLFFEIRHGFNQTHTLLQTLSKYGAVVTITGLNKVQILETFLSTFGNLLHIPALYAGLILLLLIITLIYVSIRKKVILKHDARILLLLTSLFTGTLFIYLTAKNPVWEYHFIGVDILFLLLLTYFASRLPLFRKLLVIYTIFIVCFNVATFIIYFHRHTSHYEQQLQAVRFVITDAKNQDYTVYAYNPSIYSYDFSYLFRWMANKVVPYDPGLIKQSGNIIYLIVPMQSDAHVKDFIHFRSQPDKYKEVSVWKTENSFVILKFIKR